MHYSFTQLQEQFDIPREEFYKCLQIGHFFESLYTLNANPILTPYESICQDRSREKGTLCIYKYLNNLHLPEKSAAMIWWETDLGTEFSSEEWLDMLQNMHKCTRSIAMKETGETTHTVVSHPRQGPQILPRCSRYVFRAPCFTLYGAALIFNTYGTKKPPE